MSETKPFLSVVTPVYNGEGCLDELHQRLAKVLAAIGRGHEIVMVDDGSADGTWAAMRRLADADPSVRAVRLSRNFGQHMAITAGLDACRGEWVVVMDSDLQDRPEEIPALLAKAGEGFELVFARRKGRTDGPFKRLTSRVFNGVFNVLANVRIDPDTANFGIFHRRVIDAFCAMRESARSFHSLVRVVGFETGYLDVAHDERFAGETAYDLKRMLRLATDVIVSQSGKPLVAFMKFGFLMAGASLAYGVFLMLRKWFWAYPVEGWTSVMVSMFFLAGLGFANLGVLGLYVGRLFDEAKGRPLYFVRDTAGDQFDFEGEARVEE